MIVAGGSLATADVGFIKRKTLLVSLVTISSVFVFEFIAGILANSLALLTDSTHALLDAVITLVLIIASALALKPRDTDHTYGHGKVETIGGFIGGIALFVAAIFIIYEATLRLALPSGHSTLLVNPGIVGFAALAYTIAVDVFRIGLLAKATKNAGGVAIKADLYHAFADFASTIVAFIGIWLVTVGFNQGDSIAAIILGGFLAYLSTRFAYQNATELSDAISPKLVSKVRQAANSTEGVLESKDLKMRKVGRDTFVELTVVLDSTRSFESAHETSARVEANIEKSLIDAGLQVTPRDIIVHFEPVSSVAGMPAETIVESAAASVGGVRGVHNILVSRIGGTSLIGISLHIQVRRSASISEAHSIANAVEDSIKKRLKGIENITVHLEPQMPNLGGVQPVFDREIQDTIRAIVTNKGDVRRTSRIAAYRTEEGILKIDVGCIFRSTSDGEMTIEQVHDRVSEIEKQIRAMYPGSIVTIHAEPS